MNAALWNDDDGDENESEFTSSVAVSKGETIREAYSKVKIGLVDAIKIALKNTNGIAVEAELEREKGFLIYEVAILTEAGKLFEVAVDPGTGKVIGTEEDD